MLNKKKWGGDQTKTQSIKFLIIYKIKMKFSNSLMKILYYIII